MQKILSVVRLKCKDYASYIVNWLKEMVLTGIAQFLLGKSNKKTRNCTIS